MKIPASRLQTAVSYNRPAFFPTADTLATVKPLHDDTIYGTISLVFRGPQEALLPAGLASVTDELSAMCSGVPAIRVQPTPDLHASMLRILHFPGHTFNDDSAARVIELLSGELDEEYEFSWCLFYLSNESLAAQVFISDELKQKLTSIRETVAALEGIPGYEPLWKLRDDHTRAVTNLLRFNGSVPAALRSELAAWVCRQNQQFLSTREALCTVNARLSFVKSNHLFSGPESQVLYTPPVPILAS